MFSVCVFGLGGFLALFVFGLCWFVLVGLTLDFVLRAALRVILLFCLVLL